MDENPWGNPSPPTLIPATTTTAATPLPEAPPLNLPDSTVSQKLELDTEHPVTTTTTTTTTTATTRTDENEDEWEVDSDDAEGEGRDSFQLEVQKAKKAIVQAEEEEEEREMAVVDLVQEEQEHPSSSLSLSLGGGPLLPMSPPKGPYEEPPMDDFEDDAVAPLPTSSANPVPIMPSQIPPPTPTTSFGEFDDFGPTSEEDDDDDFGDFGDFDEGDGGDDAAFGAAPLPPPSSFARPADVEQRQAFASTSSAGFLPPLRMDLSNEPSREVIGRQLENFFESAYPWSDQYLSDENERQVEGIGQILVNESL